MIEAIDGIAEMPQQVQVEAEKTFEKILAAAQPGAVFATPVASGPYTIITASEVLAAGGFGSGKGTGSEGGFGGGGVSQARPVAAIVIGPEGVKVQPVTDATKIALAAVAAWGTVALTAIRLVRASKRTGKHSCRT
jgi:uncharacterized spore protein YtfJ